MAEFLIGGIKTRVVSQEEAEEADIVVCCTADMWSPFADNVETVCADCGSDIFHRPNAPARPPKVCIACAGKRVEREGAGHA